MDRSSSADLGSRSRFEHAEEYTCRVGNVYRSRIGELVPQASRSA